MRYLLSQAMGLLSSDGVRGESRGCMVLCERSRVSRSRCRTLVQPRHRRLHLPLSRPRRCASTTLWFLSMPRAKSTRCNSV